MRVVVGRIGKAHGIRGEVTIEVRTDEPERRFAPGAVVFMGETDRPLVVESMRAGARGLVVGFRGFTDRNAAETLRGTLVEAERSFGDTPEGEDEFYDSDLIGLIVRDAAGQAIGVIDDVVHLPAQDLLSVQPASAQGHDSVPQPSWLLPFVTEFVPEVNTGEGWVQVTPPPGIEILHDVDGQPVDTDK